MCMRSFQMEALIELASGKVRTYHPIRDPDGHFKFLHPWPGQIPPGQATVVGGLLLVMGALRKAIGGFFEAVALALEFEQHAAV